ncbi:MAG: hypothetical protein Q8Q59_01450 [Luteolibacter sp.]|nr:hypothetical protein [Luteolibacter sp.]
MRQILHATLLLTLLASASAAPPHPVTVDFSQPQGKLRALHGINCGPLASNNLVDVTEAQKLLRPPSTRLHDCHYPNPDVVDLSAVFPNPDADPALPANYNFAATDEYVASVRATGAEVMYRLGQSIEWQTVKRHVHPPKDPVRWAAACAGIIRHYNEGWANGFHYGIRNWEIWNEPENRPVMWTGDDARFLELYRVTSRLLRKEFPGIRIGGCGFGYYGKFDGKELAPSEFVIAFLEMCRRDSLPLDFFSWHCYTNNPAETVARARAVRRLLDSYGFTKAESHLNEWNYLHENQWNVLKKNAAPEIRQRSVDQMTGAAGGTFLVASLLELQDAPVEMANFYHGATGLFGLFTEVGAPTWNYHAMRTFVQLLETAERVRVSGTMPGKLAVAAGISATKDKATVLVANLSGEDEIRLSLAHLPWAGESVIEVSIVDGRPGELPAGSELTLKIPPPAVALVTLRPKLKK